jgi:hypothetical protein
MKCYSVTETKVREGIPLTLHPKYGPGIHLGVRGEGSFETFVKLDHRDPPPVEDGVLHEATPQKYEVAETYPAPIMVGQLRPSSQRVSLQLAERSEKGFLVRAHFDLGLAVPCRVWSLFGEGACLAIGWRGDRKAAQADELWTVEPYSILVLDAFNAKTYVGFNADECTILSPDIVDYQAKGWCEDGFRDAETEAARASILGFRRFAKGLLE